jgi:hypothetical protein
MINMSESSKEDFEKELYIRLECWFLDMNNYHTEMVSATISKNYHKSHSFEYHAEFKRMYQKLAYHVHCLLKLHENKSETNSQKQRKLTSKQKDTIIKCLEDYPRLLCSFDIVPSLDLMFRADGHKFSSLFKYLKKIKLYHFR